MAAPEPSPACMVCGTATAQLALNTASWTLQQLVDKARGQGGVGREKLCRGLRRSNRISTGLTSLQLLRPRVPEKAPLGLLAGGPNVN